MTKEQFFKIAYYILNYVPTMSCPYQEQFDHWKNDKGDFQRRPYCDVIFHDGWRHYSNFTCSGLRDICWLMEGFYQAGIDWDFEESRRMLSLCEDEDSGNNSGN